MNSAVTALFSILSALSSIETGAVASEINVPWQGIPSPYTEVIRKLSRNWPPSKQYYDWKEQDDPLRIHCWETPGSPLYMGIEQFMFVNSSFEKVEATLDAIDEYEKFFPDFEDIHVIDRRGNRVHTYWEQDIPTPLIPNIIYEMIYQLEKPEPNKKIYQYQLRTSSHLKFSDGFILIERVGSDRVAYTEIDFFDADWGIAKALGVEKLWRDTVDGIYISDIAIKLKSEHPDWPNEKIRVESKKASERFPVAEKVKNRRPFQSSGYRSSSPL